MRGKRSVLGSLIFLLGSVAASASELRDLRVLEGVDSTRTVLDLDAESTYKVFTLANPDRLVIDIDNAHRAAALQIDPASKGFVKDVRTGPHENGLRVVIDLNAPVSPKSFGLAPSEGFGYRLIFDLFPKDDALANSAAAPAPVQAVVAAEPAPATAAVASGQKGTSATVLKNAPVAPAPKAADVAAQVTQVTIAPPPSSLNDKLQLTNKQIVVAIDAGHGGEDPGAHGPNGLLEKDVTLAIARRLAAQINAQPGMRAVMTRDGDYYVGLRERTVKAREAQADLFVSIHANAYKDREMRGTAVYVLSDHGASTEQARWIASSENAADLVGGVKLHDKDADLAAVLIDISQSATMDASFDLGTRMLSSLEKVNELQKPVVQQAGFMVLKSPDIPSVLVETAFISNPVEEKHLGNSEYQDKLALSIFEGVRGYFSRYRPLQQVVHAEHEVSHVSANNTGRGRAIPVSLNR
jgi:N-acetylmuramoyl-L-alanine amidase